jgi:hypothetical protein
MKRLIVCSLCMAAGFMLAPIEDPAAQNAAPAEQPVLTTKAAEGFLTAAGLQICEISEVDPMVAQIYHTLKSLSGRGLPGPEPGQVDKFAPAFKG